METSYEATIHECNKIISGQAVCLRTGDVLELGLRFLNISVACQFCALLSHVLTAYYLVTFVDSCFITRFHVFSSSRKLIH